MNTFGKHFARAQPPHGRQPPQVQHAIYIRGKHKTRKKAAFERRASRRTSSRLDLSFLLERAAKHVQLVNARDAARNVCETRRVRTLPRNHQNQTVVYKFPIRRLYIRVCVCIEYNARWMRCCFLLWKPTTTLFEAAAVWYVRAQTGAFCRDVCIYRAEKAYLWARTQYADYGQDGWLFSN